MIPVFFLCCCWSFFFEPLSLCVMMDACELDILDCLSYRGRSAESPRHTKFLAKGSTVTSVQQQPNKERTEDNDMKGRGIGRQQDIESGGGTKWLMMEGQKGGERERGQCTRVPTYLHFLIIAQQPSKTTIILSSLWASSFLL